MSKISVKTSKLPHITPVIIAVAGNNPPNPSTYIYFGQLNDHPPIVGIGIKEKRFTYKLIRKFKDWTINIIDKSLVRQGDRAGTISGNKQDKTKILDIEYIPSEKIQSFGIKKAPVIYEVQYTGELKLPDHNLVYGEVVNVRVDEKYISENKINLKKIPFVLSSYNSMDYYTLGEKIAHWGFGLKEEK